MCEKSEAILMIMEKEYTSELFSMLVILLNFYCRSHKFPILACYSQMSGEDIKPLVSSKRYNNPYRYVNKLLH